MQGVPHMATKSAMNAWKDLGFSVTKYEAESKKWHLVEGSARKPTKLMLSIVESATIRECKFEDEDPILKVHIILVEGKEHFSIWIPVDLKAVKVRKLEPGMECDINTFRIYNLTDGTTTIKRCDIASL